MRTKYVRRLKRKMTDLKPITILVSTSPRPAHPDPRILEATLNSLKFGLPDAPVIIMADGVPEDISPTRLENYGGFKEAIRRRYTVLEFDKRVHQSGMIGAALEMVKTPLIFYVEDDWLISPNVEWHKLSALILSGQTNLIKLHAGHRLHPLHWHMHVDHVIWGGVPLFRTLQWSQNPHLASTDFYRLINTKHLAGKCDYIENIMHGPTYSGGWDAFKLCIYDPENEGTMQMVTHLDGREGER
jgi:hypothetical protein